MLSAIKLHKHTSDAPISDLGAASVQLQSWKPSKHRTDLRCLLGLKLFKDNTWKTNNDEILDYEYQNSWTFIIQNCKSLQTKEHFLGHLVLHQSPVQKGAFWSWCQWCFSVSVYVYLQLGDTYFSCVQLFWWVHQGSYFLFTSKSWAKLYERMALISITIQMIPTYSTYDLLRYRGCILYYHLFQLNENTDV